VVVVDDDGRLMDDVTVLELFLADPETAVAALVGPPWPVTVALADEVDDVINRLVDSRRTSVVVLDDEGRPVGRIMADDAIDALVGDRGRFRFPRLLS
jgi:Mg/Co/Ni transporter MgtE